MVTVMKEEKERGKNPPKGLLAHIAKADKDENKRLQEMSVNKINHRGEELAFLKLLFFPYNYDDRRIRSKDYSVDLLNDRLIYSGAKGKIDYYQNLFKEIADKGERLFKGMFTFVHDCPQEIVTEYVKMLRRTVINYFNEQLKTTDSLYTRLQTEYLLNKFHSFSQASTSFSEREQMLTEAVYFDIFGCLPCKNEKKEDDPFFNKYERDSIEFNSLQNTVGLYSRSGFLKVLALANKGNSLAMQAAGTMEFFGILGERDFNKAFYWHFREIKETGSGQAAWSIADMLYRYDTYKDQFPNFRIYNPITKEEIIKPNSSDSKAIFNWNEEISKILMLAYQRGSKAAGNLIAQIIEDESFSLIHKVKFTNIKPARDWALEAAEGGNPNAMYRMYIYCSKESEENTASKEKLQRRAIEWLNKSADCFLPVAMRDLAVYHYSRGNHLKAQSLLHKLIDEHLGAIGNYYSSILTAMDYYPDMYTEEEKRIYLEEAIEGASKQYFQNRPKGNEEFINECVYRLSLLDVKRNNK